MYSITMFLNDWCKRPVDEPHHYAWFIKAVAYLPFLHFKYVIAPGILMAFAREVERVEEIHRLIEGNKVE